MYKQIKGFCMLLLTSIIWGIAFVAQSAGMDYVGGFTFNFMRFIIGAVVLIPCMFLLKHINKNDKTNIAKTIKESNKTLIIGGIFCGFFLCLASNLQQFGIKYTTVGKAGFITALYIIIVPILGIFLKKKVGLKIWLSVALAVVGLYLLCMSGSLTIGKGDFLVILCAIVFSFHILTVDYFAPKVDGVKLSCIQFFVAGILSGIPMLIFEEVKWSAIVDCAVPILYAGVLSCGVAYTMQILGQKNLNPVVASMVMSLESVFSVIAGAIILHQILSGRELLGCVFMFAGIILSQINLPTKKKEMESTYEI